MREIETFDSYSDIVEQFPGVEQGDVSALGQFAYAITDSNNKITFNPSNERDDDYQEWHENINEATGIANAIREDYLGESRIVAIQKFKKRVALENSFRPIRQAITELGAEEAYQIASQFVLEKGFGKAVDLKEGPMTPDGGKMLTPLTIDDETNRLDTYTTGSIEDADGNRLDHTILEFLGEGIKQIETRRVRDATVEALEPISREQIDKLRKQYGAKATSLHLFAQRIEVLNEATKETSLLRIKIPPYKAVSVDLYRAWKDGDADKFDEMLERVRKHALELFETEKNSYEVADSRLIAVRSSAVHSEDGINATGAGIYHSTVMDPREPEAFRDAVTQVFKSTNSEMAQSYRESIGVQSEEMGLLLQKYVEVEDRGYNDLFWGYVNTRGANPNIMDLNAREGQLLYDRSRVADRYLLQNRIDANYGDNLLHTHPDRDSKIYEAIRDAKDVVYAAHLAEKLFDMPMQIEFVMDQIVQVRPLLDKFDTDIPIIEFPDMPHIAELSGVGTFDGELEILKDNQDNNEKQGLVIFWSEDKYTLRGSFASFTGKKDHGINVFPKSGAVMIANPSTHGHIQSLCRELDLACIFPSSDSGDIYDILDKIDGLEGDNPKLRVVSDGYRARLYVPEANSINGSNRT